MVDVEEVIFSKEDRKILESYKDIVHAIGSIFGSSCEVVLHSLEDLSSSVICIHNGAKTGRDLGSPVTDKALAILKQCEKNHTNYVKPYMTQAHGHNMRSVTTIIRNLEGNPIGMLCINFDLDTPLSELMHCLLDNTTLEGHNDNEYFASNIDDLLTRSVNLIVSEVKSDESIGARQKTKVIIERINEQGLFKLKNSVNKIASILGLSRDAVYLHLRNLKKEDL